MSHIYRDPIVLATLPDGSRWLSVVPSVRYPDGKVRAILAAHLSADGEDLLGVSVAQQPGIAEKIHPDCEYAWFPGQPLRIPPHA